MTSDLSERRNMFAMDLSSHASRDSGMGERGFGRAVPSPSRFCGVVEVAWVTLMRAGAGDDAGALFSSLIPS